MKHKNRILSLFLVLGSRHIQQKYPLFFGRFCCNFIDF